MLHLLLLAGAAAVIYFSCELFVNAVEHLGRLWRVGTLAIGTVLAAVGTALPESVVTGIAVTNGHPDIGVGAALGGPLALATIGYGAVGLALLSGRRALPAISTARLGRDQASFLAVFVVKVGLGLVAFAWKPWLGLVFFAVYVIYVVAELRADDDDAHGLELEPLRLTPRTAEPRLLPVLAQTLGTLAAVFAASQVFVAQLAWTGSQLGVAPTVVALVLSPVATELPEVMNALIWVRQGKAQLALANVSGSMMVQATVPSGLGILFTSWHFDGPLVLSGLVTMAAIVFLLLTLKSGRLSARRLAAASAFYLVFAVLVSVV